MAGIMEARDVVGDPNRAVTELTTVQTPDTAKAATSSPAKTTDRFDGKSREDILESYRNLESHTGRLASELGYQKRTIEELLEDKRRRDLGMNGATKTEIEASDILTKPTEALDKFLEERLPTIVKPLQDRLNQLEGQLGNIFYETKHKDASQITQSPEFKTWVGETGLRQHLAAQAAGGNAQAAAALLDEWKAGHKPEQGGDMTQTREEALRVAERVMLEGNRNSSSESKSTGKIYNRADLIALRQTNPDKYAELGSEILKAYNDGRVR